MPHLLPHAGLMAWLFVVIGLAFWIGLFVLIVLGIRWLIRQDRSSRLPPSGTPPSGTPPDAASMEGPGSSPDPGSMRAGTPTDPLEILRQRYARGEIDDEEYERRRRTLTAS